MTTLTDNHDLHQYDPDDDEWTHSDDMATIETRLVIRDEEANLGNYTPHEHATFIAANGAVYDGDGEDWIKATRAFEAASVDDAPTDATDVARKAETDALQADVDDHSARHEAGGDDELSVTGLSGDLADEQDPKDHADRHGYDGADELATALRYDPQAEPATPTTGCVRWYDETDDAYKVKFDDGATITVGAK